MSAEIEPQQQTHKFDEDDNPPPPHDDDSDDDDDVVHNSSSTYQQQQQQHADHQQNYTGTDEEELQEPEEQAENDAFTSIWDMVGTYTQSPLETMLSKDNVSNVTLKQVLDEETLIQEVKAANAKVIEYIAKEDIVKQMLSFLAVEHYKEDLAEPLTDNPDEENNKLIYKYPFVVCEIVCCDIDDVNEQIVGKEENIITLFNFLSNRDHSKTALNPSLSQYFIKSVSLLLQKHYTQITSVLVSKHNDEQYHILQKLLLSNISLCDMDTFIMKLIGFEISDDAQMGGEGGGEFGGNSMSQQRVRELFLLKQRGNDKQVEDQRKKMQQWSMDNGFLNLLIDRLEQVPNDDDAARNIFSILTLVIDKGASVIQSKLLTKEPIQRIMAILLNHHQHVPLVVYGLSFFKTVMAASETYNDGSHLPEAIEAIHSRSQDLIALLQSPLSTFSSCTMVTDSTTTSSSSSSTSDSSNSTTATTTTTSSDQQQQQQQQQPPPTTTAAVVPATTTSSPLGEKRLKIIEHLFLLFKCNYVSIHQDMQTYKALPILVDLFFQYEYNNLLHVAVFQIIKHVIENSGNVDLKSHLLVDCRIAERILEANQKNDTLIKSVGNKARLGNMGTITDIANLLRKASVHQDIVNNYLSSVNGWKAYIDGSLAEINAIMERQLGGPVPIGGGFGGSNLANSALAYGNSSNSYSMADNDDDDDDDDDEDYVEDDSSDSDDSSDDEVIVNKTKPTTTLEQQPADQQEQQPAAVQQDFEANFDTNFDQQQ